MNKTLSVNKIILAIGAGLFTAFLLQACQPKYKAEASCGFIQNAYGERVAIHDLPLHLSLHSSYPEIYRPVFIIAMQEWETRLNRPLFILEDPRDEGPLDPRRDSKNVIYWMDTWEADKSTEQARTSVYWEGDAIREADMRINAHDFTFYEETPKGEKNEVHLKSLLIHELGHVLGLAHRNDTASVMQPYLADDTSRPQLASIDVQSASCEY